MPKETARKQMVKELHVALAFAVACAIYTYVSRFFHGPKSSVVGLILYWVCSIVVFVSTVKDVRKNPDPKWLGWLIMVLAGPLPLMTLGLLYFGYTIPIVSKRYILKREYIKLTLDGVSCINTPSDACDHLQDADEPKAFKVESVWMTPYRFSKLPEFDGF